MVVVARNDVNFMTKTARVVKSAKHALGGFLYLLEHKFPIFGTSSSNHQALVSKYFINHQTHDAWWMQLTGRVVALTFFCERPNKFPLSTCPNSFPSAIFYSLFACQFWSTQKLSNAGSHLFINLTERHAVTFHPPCNIWEKAHSRYFN